MLDLLLIMALGFLGSFGHCAGMCGPLTVAFALSHESKSLSWWQQLRFHALLNLGRIVSYTLAGAGIGALGSVLIAGGQMAGIGSALREGITLLTGSLLVWFGLTQIKPGLLPYLPLFHPLQGGLHHRLSNMMVKLSTYFHWWTPALLGLAWGFMPCGFLYTAQIKAAETGNLWTGSATMLAFGLGTLPTMVGVGLSASLVSADQRSQLFRLGGWITLVIGIITLLRTGDTAVDYTGHGALLLLMLALLARPLNHLWAQPLRYRRVLGVGAFLLSLVHLLHMSDHMLGWNLEAVSFMVPLQQIGLIAGTLALALMLPAALTSFDRAVQVLGRRRWRQVHLLSVPALWLCVVHAVLNGSHYLGGLEWTPANQLRVVLLGLGTLGVMLMRYTIGPVTSKKV